MIRKRSLFSPMACDDQQRGDEFQNYAVSRLDGSFPSYSQQPLSTTGASTTIIDTKSYLPDDNITSITNIDMETKATTLHIIIGASVSGAVVLGLVIFSCITCLCRRQTFGVKQVHISAMLSNLDANMYQQLNVVVDPNVYDAMNNQT
ncbi:hypothetical protein CHS0354_018992 [Potamilus streckersoni]|uniref:Uncharacterized protein n=1 Tax=Potamilus streckersoni TaxID=2493646 RepID=A0AAE0SRS0_9BIVA|nr:hypothetical protein CHS0354_018992 [Potamilus streckersoni]